MLKTECHLNIHRNRKSQIGKTTYMQHMNIYSIVIKTNNKKIKISNAKIIK